MSADSKINTTVEAYLKAKDMYYTVTGRNITFCVSRAEGDLTIQESSIPQNIRRAVRSAVLTAGSKVIKI